MIIPVTYTWRGKLEKREKTTHIILHHTASTTATPQEIHQWHLDNGKDWKGFGYHFYIKKDGKIYQGRPIDAIGAHCEGWNDKSVGICFEGNFDQEEMTAEQVKSGIELIRLVRSQYRWVSVTRHKDCGAKSSCPGENFRNDIIFEGSKDAMNEVKTVDEALLVLVTHRIIESPDYWLKVLAIVKFFDVFVIKVANALLKI